ncbi:MAG: carbon-nitrogen hydrolase family protein [Pontimonas sp.]
MMVKANRSPTVRVATVQASPVFMDRDATVEITCEFIAQAGNEGAQLVAFPEVFIAGYPYWSRFLLPLEAQHFTLEMLHESVEVPSEATERLCRAAHKAGTYVVVGINESVPTARGTLFNTNLTISPEGKIVNHHRKLVPTYAEKMVWTYGDGYGLRVLNTEIGRIGTLICGENANPLARFLMIAEGEQIHVANYPSLPSGNKGGYDLSNDIRIRSSAHAFEGKIFTVASCSTLGPSIVDYFKDYPDVQKLLQSQGTGHTAIYGPWGVPVAGPLEPGVEDVLYADINLDDALLPKLRHDVAWSYNRFDVMRVLINRSGHRAIESVDSSFRDGDASRFDTQNLLAALQNNLQDGHRDGALAVLEDLKAVIEGSAPPASQQRN